MTLVKKIIMPQLYDAGGDMKKQWFVFYSYRDPTNGRMKRFKVFGKINSFKTSKARYKAAYDVISDLNIKLNRGYSPFEDKQYVYENVLNYAKSGKKHKSGQEAFEFTIEHYLSNILASHKANVKKRTFQLYQSHARVFSKWLIQNELDQIKIEDFSSAQAQSFLNELDLHDQTRTAYRTNLKRLFNLLIDQEIIVKNVWEKTRLPKPQTTNAYRAFRLQEVRKIKRYCQTMKLTEIWMVAQFLYYCFIRPKELRLLKVSDIDLDNQKILIRAEISKNGKREFVDIPDNFVEPLLDWVEERQPNWFVFGEGPRHRRQDYFRSKHKHVLNELGFGSDVSLYSWKHTGVVSFYKNGSKDLKALQRQLRHHDIAMVDKYLHSLGLEENTQVKENFPAI